jgi:hypothetical protein
MLLASWRQKFREQFVASETVAHHQVRQSRQSPHFARQTFDAIVGQLKRSKAISGRTVSLSLKSHIKHTQAVQLEGDMRHVGEGIA